MITLTKEWLLKTIAELEEERDATPGAVNEDADKALEAMKIALVSLEAKDKIPELRQVIYHFRDWNEGFPVERFKADYVISWMLVNYPPAQPAAVSVPDEEQCKPHPVMAVKGELGFLDHFDRIISERDEDIDIGQLGSSNYEALMLAAVDAFRAAMLQGADEKPELTVWYGSMPETNGKTNWTAMLHRKVQHPWEGITIECSEYPDRVRYEADRMRHLIGELSEGPDILEYDADAHSGYVKLGNSPVIPDGWVACSERMPETMVSVLVTGTWFHHAVAFWDGLSWCDLDFEQPVTHWMPLPAAPQQEAKNV